MGTIFFINGFLECGKTTFIRELIEREKIRNCGKVLILVCEEGEEEYDTEALVAEEIYVEWLLEEKQFQEAYLTEIEKKFRPDLMIVEFNGMWNRREIHFPKYWKDLAEVAVIDATMFKIYSENLTAYQAEQIRNAEIVIFNRCDTVREHLAAFARNVKAINPRTLLLFKGAEGDIFLSADELLPYDIRNDTIELDDEGFVAFCIDIHERLELYENKTVTFVSRAYQTKTDNEMEFVGGRYVMTCCEADMTFLGMLCAYAKAYELQQKEWVRVSGTVRRVYDDLAQREIPVCVVRTLEITETPKREVISLTV